ncbi:hypothetical protein Tco_0469125 [Tanacetum coccineum]
MQFYSQMRHSSPISAGYFGHISNLGLNLYAYNIFHLVIGLCITRFYHLIRIGCSSSDDFKSKLCSYPRESESTYPAHDAMHSSVLATILQTHAECSQLLLKIPMQRTLGYPPNTLMYRRM